jgi:hypothetical protein
LTAIQKVEVRHDTDVRSPPEVIALVVHVLPPLYSIAFPALSTAMQKVVALQETEFITLLESIGFTQDVPLVQLVPLYSNAPPALSTAIQKVELIHDTEVSATLFDKSKGVVQVQLL